MTTFPVLRSARCMELCSAENAIRIAGKLFDQTRESISVVTTNEPLQPLRVMHSCEVTNPNDEIAIVTG